MRSKIDISADHSLSGLQISNAEKSSEYTSALESLLSELRELNPLDIQASIQNFGHELPSHVLSTALSRMDVTAGAAWENLPALIAADAIPHVEGCDCGACSFKEEELTRIDNGTGDGGVSGTGNAAILGDMADFLLTGYWNTNFGDGTRSHNVTSSGVDANDGVLHFNLSGYSADSDGVTSDRAFLIREAFKLFEATLGIQFVETTSTDTNVVDFFFRDNDSGAYASHSYYNSGAWGSSIHYAQINVAQSWSGGTSTYDDYTLQTILHEIGHALGLGHQGPYNGSATYGTDNQFDNDSWQASMMSYFSQTENSSIDASYELLQTPMAVDWIALDEIYGRQGYGTSNAFVEDTVWGFNTTVTSEVSDIWANWYLYADRTASTIVDGGGIDTLDLSGYNNNTLINLAPSDAGSTSPSISDVGGRIGNLTIAQGTIIENAIGGAGSETFYGNSANNSFIGNGGDDTFYDSLGSDTYNGGAGIDYVVFGNSFGSYLIEIVGGVLQVIDTAIDWVEDTVEWLTFAGETFSWQAVANSIGPNTAPVANDDSYSVSEDDILSVNDFLANDTDADGNTLNVASVNGVVIESGVDGTQINLASGAILTVYKNGAFDYDSNGVFDDLNVGEQAFDSFNYIASDGRDQSNPATVTITVVGAFDNTPPQAVSDSYTVDEDVVLAGIDVLANDSDIDVGQDLSIIAIEGVNISAGQTLLLLNGALVTLNSDGTLDYDQNGAFDDLSAGQGGIDYFIYSVSDGTSSSDAIVSISINGVTDNLNPTATDDTGSVAENATTTGNVLSNDNDQDGGTLSVTAVNGALENVGSQIVLASGALLTLSASGDYLYDPNGAFDALEDGQSASDAFTYTISDGQGGSATASVSVTISGVSPPTVSEAILIDFEGMATGPYTGQDDLVFAGLNTVGTTVLNGSSAGSSGADGDFSITTTGEDFDLNGFSAIVSSGRNKVLIQAYDDDVLVASQQINVSARRPLDVTLDSTFDSVDQVVFTSGAQFFIDDISLVTSTIADPGGNTPPVAADDQFAVAESGLLGTNLLENDSDLDGDPLTLVSVAGNTSGPVTLGSGAVVTFSANGAITYDPNGAFDYLYDTQTATDTFMYEISDGAGGTDTATVTVEIAGSGEAPSMEVLDFEAGLDSTRFVVSGAELTSENPGVASGQNAAKSLADSITIDILTEDHFDFESGVFTALGKGRTDIVIEGQLDSEVVASQTVRVRAGKEENVLLSDAFDVVDSVTITSSGGIIVDDLAFFV